MLLFSVDFLPGQSSAVVPGCTEAYFKMVTGALANDSMQGRLPGTEQETAAGNFIAAEFKRAGCKTIGRQGVFPFSYLGPDSQTVIRSNGNVIARINTRSEYAIVISAHYDHIGKGKFHSKAPFSNEIHNGADDNASGVAMMLGLAGWCSQHKEELKYDIIFAAFSGEEDGLYGSLEFLQYCPVDTSRILCNINLDMVGRLDLVRPVLRIDAALEFPVWDSVLPADTGNGFLVMKRKNEIKGGADNCSFLDQRIPAILITTGLHGEYHTPYDDVQLLNYPGMILVADYLGQLLLNLNRRKDCPLLFGRK